MTCSCNPYAEEAETGRFLGSLVSKSGLIDKLQVPGGDPLSKTKQIGQSLRDTQSVLSGTFATKTKGKETECGLRIQLSADPLTNPKKDSDP